MVVAVADRDKITIVYDAETTGVERGGRRTVDSLSDVDQALDDLSSTSGDAAQDVESDLDKVGSASDDAGGKIGDLGGVARDALEGDVSGAAQSAAEALSALGPTAAVAGVVGAAGISLVTGALTAQQEEANKVRDDMVGMYRDAAEEGRKYLDEAQIIAAANDVLFDSEKRKNAAEEANRIGVELITYIRAQAGDQAALNTVLERGNALLAEAGQIGEDKSKAGQAAALDEKNAIAAVVRENERLLEIHKEGQEAATLASQLVAEQQAAQRDEINRTAQVATDRLNGLAAQAGKGIQVKLNVDTSQAAKDIVKFSNSQIINVKIRATDPYGRVF